LYRHIFHLIFLSNYWWQESDIWSQASYWYAILWEVFLDPSDSYFLFAKTLPLIWGTYMKLVTTYQISAINSCWEKCDEKWAYMFNVYKNQLSRQTGSRNLTGPKTLPTIWYTYITRYNIIIPPLPKGGGGYTVLPLSVCPSVRSRYFSSHFSQ
jgi:hypothetical protein